MRPIFVFLLFISISGQASEPSRCFGTTDKGRLENGWQLPSSGSNFSAYSLFGTALGRNYVHSSVYKTVLDAYTSLNTTLLPQKNNMFMVKLVGQQVDAFGHIKHTRMVCLLISLFLSSTKMENQFLFQQEFLISWVTI